jgi:hypothetical protein
VIAVYSAVLQGVWLARPTSVGATVLTLVMLLACLLCAHDLWARGTLRAWVLEAALATCVRRQLGLHDFVERGDDGCDVGTFRPTNTPDHRGERFGVIGNDATEKLGLRV